MQRPILSFFGVQGLETIAEHKANLFQRGVSGPLICPSMKKKESKLADSLLTKPYYLLRSALLEFNILLACDEIRNFGDY
jgi:hypothetical protein